MFSGYMLALGQSAISLQVFILYFQGSHILNLLALTLTVESAFDSVQNLMREKEEKLLRTKEKFEREKLKFDMRRLYRLQPMTGEGFFTISKSTLTSMLSVR